MKTKVILLIAISAIVTLSFTFASVKSTKVEQKSTEQTHEAPAGGFVSEDKI